MFSLAVTVNVSSPVPDVRERLSQETLHEAVQDRYDTTVSDSLPLSDAKESDIGETLKTAGSPFCVTVILYDELPALNVIVPVRLSMEVLASAVTDNVASPVLDVRESVSQETSHEAVHDWLDFTDSDVLLLSDVKERDIGLTLNVGSAPYCVTETSYDESPTENTIVPLRLSMEVLVSAVTDNVASPVPEVFESDIQLTFVEDFQLWLLVIFRSLELDEDK